MIRILDQDIAIPIAWPDQTARGDEKWMRVLKRIRLIRNLNFRVGHAAILMVRRSDGQVCYFDFGRYITPRGYGRARSGASDPRLRLETKARFDNHTDKLTNLEEILTELERKKDATHGGGRLLCSLCEHVSFSRGIEFAERLVETGPILYGALARNNNSCSRYVAQILVQAMRPGDPRIHKILYPEIIKASPTSNVVNAATAGTVYCFANGEMQEWSMGRLKSLSFQINLLKDNFTASGARHLADDGIPGQIGKPARAPGIPDHAQWLGGIGEGKWFCLDDFGDFYRITRFDTGGEVDYMVRCLPDLPFDYTAEYSFTFDIHYKQHILQQGTEKIAFLTQNHDIARFKRDGIASFADAHSLNY